MEFTYYPDVLNRVISLFTNKGLNKMDSMSSSIIQELEGYAKLNAPWQDRTGNARAGLKGAVNREKNAITISIAHSVDYGIYLERSNSGRFAILAPTLTAMRPKIIEHYRKAWR